jgi:DNA-binding response OmpR family regulator
MAKILLVGADEAVRDMYFDVLNANGFDVVAENTAKDGLDRLSDEFFPACVVFLPREETLWFLIKVRSTHNVKISTIPILAVVDESSESLSEYIEMGATKAIIKFPASGDKLVRELKSILNIPRMGPNLAG